MKVLCSWIVLHGHSDIPYTSPHWLFDVIVYLIFSVWDFFGLYIFQILLTILLGLILYYSNYKLYNQKGIAFFITCITLVLIKNFITVRAQLVTYILFILEIYFLERYFSKSNKFYLLGLIFLSFLMANIHVAVWPFYFVLFLPYFISCIKINIDKITTEKYKGFILLIITFILCGLVGFLTPTGNTPFTYLINTMKGNTTKNISEHLPLSMTSDLGITFIIYIIFVVLIVWFSNIKVSTKNMALFAGLSIITISSTRQISLFLLIMTFVTNKMLYDVYEKYKQEGIDEKSKKALNITKRFYFIPLIIFLIVVIFVYGKPKRNQKFIDTSTYPVDAANFINENIDKENMVLFNEYNYGSYLLFKDIKVFIDSRADLYTKEFNGKLDIFSDYINTSSIGVYYEETFTKYKITHVLLYKNSKLSMLIEKDRNYNRIYLDNNFVIYERNL